MPCVILVFGLPLRPWIDPNQVRINTLFDRSCPVRACLFTVSLLLLLILLTLFLSSLAFPFSLSRTIWFPHSRGLLSSYGLGTFRAAQCQLITSSAKMNLHGFPIYPIAIFLRKDTAAVKAPELVSR
jgi:hypothetical protein